MNLPAVVGLSLSLMLIMISTGCVQAPGKPAKCISEETEWIEENAGEWNIPPDKYVFIDHISRLEGDDFGNNCTFHNSNDRITYSFDEETGSLCGTSLPSINESLKVIYYDSYILMGWGDGTYSMNAVYTLPFESYPNLDCGQRCQVDACHKGFKIVAVDSSGTTRIEYRNETIVLKSGESWENSTMREIIETVPVFKRTSNGYEIIYSVNQTIRFTDNDQIVNHGILEKKNIKSGKAYSRVISCPRA